MKCSEGEGREVKIRGGDKGDGREERRGEERRGEARRRWRGGKDGEEKIRR